MIIHNWKLHIYREMYSAFLRWIRNTLSHHMIYEKDNKRAYSNIVKQVRSQTPVKTKNINYILTGLKDQNPHFTWDKTLKEEGNLGGPTSENKAKQVKGFIVTNVKILITVKMLKTVKSMQKVNVQSTIQKVQEVQCTK